jgi:TonB family protein
VQRSLSSISFNAFGSEVINPFNAHSCAVPDYSDQMLRENKEGVVKLRFDIDSKGKTQNIQVESSSGVRELDNASVSALKSCEFSIAAANKLISFNWKIQ